MSTDACPVCGAVLWCTLPNGDTVFDCGKCSNVPCPNAESLAIEQAAEITRLTDENARLKAAIEMNPLFKPRFYEQKPNQDK